MNIAVDTRWIFGEISGIGAYTRELLHQLLRLDRENNYWLLFDRPELRDRLRRELEYAGRPNTRDLILPYGLFSPINQLRLPGLLRKLEIRVFHSPNYMIPLAAFPAGRRGTIRCVTTLHDLIPLTHPDYAPRSRKNRIPGLYRAIMRQVAKRSDLIITVSRCSQDDICAHLPCPPERIVVIPEGVSEKFKPCSQEETAALRTARLGTAVPSAAGIILWVGRPDPYKNVLGVIETFAELRQGCPRPLVLRLAGSPDPRYPEGPRRVTELGLEDCVTWTGYLTEDALLSEYLMADVFVLPSRYEGFGLTVLEAMACGAPVVCSNRGSLPEVAADAALTVDPDDREGLRAAIRKVLSEPELAADLRGRGLRRAQMFRWEMTAAKTLAAYRKAAE